MLACVVCCLEVGCDGFDFGRFVVCDCELLRLAVLCLVGCGFCCLCVSLSVLGVLVSSVDFVGLLDCIGFVDCLGFGLLDCA